MPAEPVSSVTAPAVRYLVDDGFVVGEVERKLVGFRAYSARGLDLGAFASEADAEAAVFEHYRTRRAAH